MTNGDPYEYLKVGTVCGTTTGSYYYDTNSPNINEWRYMYAPFYPAPSNVIITNITEYEENNKKGDDNMRYLYEVILVNPKNEEFEVGNVIARSETAALMIAYNDSDFSEEESYVDFDDLKIKCRVIMEWRKEDSLEKALENIKKAIK